MKVIRALVITGQGINCENETAGVLSQVGFKTKIIHVNELIIQKKIMRAYQLLVIPGGFSYGDHIASGKMLANKIKFYLFEELERFLKAKKPILGICNGFQILVRLGILPGLSLPFQVEVTLLDNDHCQFINQWVYLKKNNLNHSFWLNHLEKLSLPLPIRHGEGKLFASSLKLKLLVQKKLPAFYYVDETHQMKKTANPNGSLLNIAGLTNLQGNILGLMPHPEAFRFKNLLPHGWQEKFEKKYQYFPFLKKEDGLGMIFFYNVFNYLKKN